MKHVILKNNNNTEVKKPNIEICLLSLIYLICAISDKYNKIKINILILLGVVNWENFQTLFVFSNLS